MSQLRYIANQPEWVNKPILSQINRDLLRKLLDSWDKNSNLGNEIDHLKHEVGILEFENDELIAENNELKDENER